MRKRDDSEGELEVVVDDEPIAKVEAAPPAPAPAPAAEIATHEEWARRKKMEERFLAPSGEFTVINPLFQDWAQARAFKGWVQGFELTEADFDQAVADAKAPTFR